MKWASRWDHYLQIGDSLVHWTGIMQSILIVFLLAMIIAHFMRKALKRDIIAYEQQKQKQAEKLKNLKKKQKTRLYQSVPSTETGTDLTNSEESKNDENTSIKDGKDSKEEEYVLDEIAWKKVKGDVFRRPKFSMILAILVGTGV